MFEKQKTLSLTVNDYLNNQTLDIECLSSGLQTCERVVFKSCIKKEIFVCF